MKGSRRYYIRAQPGCLESCEQPRSEKDPTSFIPCWALIRLNGLPTQGVQYWRAALPPVVSLASECRERRDAV